MKLERTRVRDAAHACSLIPAVVVGVLPLAAGPAVASAETRGYVISWFATATNNADFAANCPRAAQDPKRLKFATDGSLGPPARGDRAYVKGKLVSAYDYPDAVQKDPDIETVVGKYAYGFDLGGNPANKFIDPETHEKVDNQLWRAVGCTTQYQAEPPAMPYHQESGWIETVDSAPGWAIRITGADLSRDGPVTVTLDRTLQHLERDAFGRVRPGTTYVLDPSPRSHNVLSGEIRNGVLTIRPATVYLEGSMPFFSQIDLKDAHMRMRSEPGGLVGYWGGYTDWRVWVYQCTARPESACDGVGMYRALEKLADADPDPVTGQNRLISTTWRMEAVPAFLATLDGKIVAMDSNEGLGGEVQRNAVARNTAGGAPGSAARIAP